MKLIDHVNLLTEYGIVWDACIAIDGERISYAGKRADFTGTADEVIDGKGRYAAPGLIDIHCHGLGEKNFAEDPLYCAAQALSHGTTTVLPTFVYTQTTEQMVAAADVIRANKDKGVGRVLAYGAYMECPYMRRSGGGISALKWPNEVDPKDFTPLVDGMGDLPRIWAIDPERKDIVVFMAYVKEKHPDAMFALGHSHASSDACKKVEKYGIRVQTHHTDSGQAPGRAQGTPGAGCDQYTLLHNDMYAELIVDETGVHVVPDMVKLAVSIKGPDKIILITDSTSNRTDNKNNEEAGIWYGPDLNYDDIGYLSGSRMTLEHACRNLMTHTAYGLCHAIQMASANPARLLGIYDEVGSLEAGKYANVILIDDKINVYETYLRGEKYISAE